MWCCFVVVAPALVGAQVGTNVDAVVCIEVEADVEADVQVDVDVVAFAEAWIDSEIDGDVWVGLGARVADVEVEIDFGVVVGFDFEILTGAQSVVCDRDSLLSVQNVKTCMVEDVEMSVVHCCVDVDFDARVMNRSVFPLV